MIRVVAGLLRHPTNPNFVLVGERSGASYPKHWEFPGGKVEGGETDQEALVREWQEELGVTVSAGAPIATLVFHQNVKRPSLDTVLPFSITLYNVGHEDTWGVVREERWKLANHFRMGWLYLKEAPPYRQSALYELYSYARVDQWGIRIEWQPPIVLSSTFTPSTFPFLHMIAAMEQE